MYQLTTNPDMVLRLEDGACIPRGHRWWTEYEEWCAAGNTADPPPQVPEAQRNLAIRNAVATWMDSVAQGNDYDNVVSCLTYLNSSVPKFKAEAEAMLAFRDAVYAKLVELVTDPPPGVTTLEQVMPLLPQPEEFGWVRDPSPNVGPGNSENPIEI